MNVGDSITLGVVLGMSNYRDGGYRLALQKSMKDAEANVWSLLVPLNRQRGIGTLDTMQQQSMVWPENLSRRFRQQTECCNAASGYK